MKNNFQQWQSDFERVPPELEDRVLQQARTFNAFGKVVEVFVPNALGAVALMIGGEAPDRPVQNGPGTPFDEDIPLWRIPPGRY
ncbi:MAG: hypothetical protein JNM22_18695 [Saprospiraceae bacterium]|nr:hypothetical protein [Saprospiraceae bacterium]